MATLTFVSADGAENSFELAGELTVGREAGNDVVLPEGGLSRKHCRFFEEEGQVLVEDLGSSNGTFVDGERIEAPTPVLDGQEVLVANVQVMVSLGQARAGTPRRQASGVRRGNGSSARTGQMPAPAAGRKPRAQLPARGASGSGRGGVPARRGDSGEAPAEGGADAGPSARGVLKGMTGPWAGKRYALSKVVSVIGRVEGNDVVVDDDSVSRRHAEVRKSGPGYAVRDLDSANGTFVNGERVTEAPLRPGDVLKFGVVEFTYSGPSMGAMARLPGGPAAANRRKLLMMGGGGLVAVVLIIGIISSLSSPPAAPVTGQPGPAVQNDQPDVQQLLGMCRSFSDPEGNSLNWARAVQACDEVLKVDPINADARRLKKQSEKEQGQKKIFDHAHELFGLGQEEAALVEYDKLDNDTVYFAQARSEFRKAAAIIKSRSGNLCLTMNKAGAYDKAWIACKDYADYAFYQGGEPKFQRVFDELQKHYKGRDAWEHSTKYERWLKEVGTGPKLDERDVAIKNLYPDSELAQAVMRYARDPIIGINQLQKYREHGKEAAKAQLLIQYATAVNAKHQIAYERTLRNDLKSAAQAVKQEVDADKGIIPAPHQSDTVLADVDAVQKAFASNGKILITQQRFDAAFSQCNEGAKLPGSNVDLNSCFADLEVVANQAGTDSCDAVALVLKITRPESITHKTADKKKTELGCP